MKISQTRQAASLPQTTGGGGGENVEKFFDLIVNQTWGKWVNNGLEQIFQESEK